MDEERKVFKYNNKDFIIISKKSLLLYLKEKDGKYLIIKDKEILSYLHDNYEKIESDVIF